MNIKQKTNQLPLRLIVSLGLLALIRPIIKVFGDVFNYHVSALATVLITAAIAIVWISVVVKLRVKKPVIVLALSGVTYAVASIVMAVTIQLAFPNLGDSDARIPVLLTVGLVATTIFNFVYGAFLGLVAFAIQKVVNK